MNHFYQGFQLQELAEEQVFNLCYDPAGQLVILEDRQELHTCLNPDGITSQSFRQPTLQEKAHLRAAFYWLNGYQPETDASKLEQVRGYLEAVHHLCQVSAWKLASQILFIRLIATDNAEVLHQQLGTWGYYREQIELYTHLLGKLSPDELDCLCLDGLGWAYTYLGHFQTAVNYHQQNLSLARKIHDRKAEVRALGGLGFADASWGHYQTAVGFCQQQLKMMEQIDNLANNDWLISEKGRTLNTLGYIAIQLGHYRKANRYCHQALVIARELRDLQTEWYALGLIAHTYSRIGQHRTAIPYLQEQLKRGNQSSDLRQQHTALTSLGLSYCYQGAYQSGIDCLKKSLGINREIRDLEGECVTLLILGLTHSLVDDCHAAIEFFQQSLEISCSLNYQQYQSLSLSQLSYAYSGINQPQVAADYAEQSLAIACEVNTSLTKGAALAALGLAYLQQRKIIRGLLLVARSLVILPPWQSADGRAILAVVVKKITRYRFWNPGQRQ